MVVLDTDHLTLAERRESAASQILQARLDRLDTGSRATTIVTYEEQTRGWMAYAARAKTVAHEIQAYAKLKTHLLSFRNIVVLDFDERAGIEYQRLRQSRIRVGAMDLKIAAIVLAHGATLLSKNLVDFRKVPGLKVADWTLPDGGVASR
jgi:tRNA(fMet)-specific endonuclease VapC